MSRMGLVYSNCLGQAGGAVSPPSSSSKNEPLDVVVTNSHSWWRDESSNGAITFTPGRFLMHGQAEAEAKAAGIRSTELRIQGTKVSFGKQANLDLQDPATCVKFLDNMFGFLGVGVNRLTVAGGTIGQVLRFIYALPIPEGVAWVHLSTCGCNMGHCDAVTRITVTDPLPHTFEDMFKLWGDIECEIEPGLVAYEYPDGVILRVKSIEALPVLNKCSGGHLVQPNIPILGKQKLFSWSYSR
jgi:hypothetical protein